MKPGISDLSHDLDLLWTGIKTKQIFSYPSGAFVPSVPIRGRQEQIGIQNKNSKQAQAF